MLYKKATEDCRENVSLLPKGLWKMFYSKVFLNIILLVSVRKKNISCVSFTVEEGPKIAELFVELTLETSWM